MTIINRESDFKELVSFATNKNLPIHRWYTLVEGYGQGFVKKILEEQERLPKVCFDPFGGVGTTALTCQELGVQCYSFEINPFFCEVAKSKLRQDYSSDTFEKYILRVEEYLINCTSDRNYPKLESKTFFENVEREKWILDKKVAYGIIDILEFIDSVEKPYSGLFKIALANILVGVSNVYKNGKCLSYRKNWKDIQISRTEVHSKFLDICKDVILQDLKDKKGASSAIHNYLDFKNGDARKLVADLPDNSVDIVITSPPYLNSRDYTDIYRLELWILGYIEKFKNEQKLRKSALTSHVQISLEDKPYPNIKEINTFVDHLTSLNGQLWNKNIPNMVKGYFYDFDKFFLMLKPKMKPNGKIYINVSNSAYGGKICEVDKILAKIAVKRGYKFEEIRVARYVNSAKKQLLKEKLRESIIVLSA